MHAINQDLLILILWTLFGLSTTYTQAVRPLTCEQINCQNKNACQVKLINGTQVSNATCKCQGQWTGYECELKLHLSLLQLTQDLVTFHVEAKHWLSAEKPKWDENSHVQFLSITDLAISIQSGNTSDQCLVLHQRHLDNTIQLYGLKKNEHYFVCISSSPLDSCTVLGQGHELSNCVYFEYIPNDANESNVASIIVCTVMAAFIFASIVYIVTNKCNMLCYYLFHPMCHNCRKNKKLSVNKLIDSPGEEILMPPDFSLELLSHQWFVDQEDNSDFIRSETMQSTRTLDSTISFSHSTCQDQISGVSSISFDKTYSKETSSAENLKKRHHYGEQEMQHLKHLIKNQFSSDNWLTVPLNNSHQFTSWQDCLLAHSQESELSPAYLSQTLPRTTKLLKRPSTLTLPLNTFLQEDGYGSNIISPHGPITKMMSPFKRDNRLDYFDHNSKMVRRFKRNQRSSDDDEFENLQSPLALDRIKASKQKSLSSRSCSASCRSWPKLSSFSIFVDHPSDYWIPPFSHLNLNHEEDVTSLTSADLCSDLNSGSLSSKDSILSYEGDSSNLVTPFQVESDSDDTYTDIESMNCSVETLNASSFINSIV
nr:hypothetical protein BgiMline_029732 [Biomphalaria glabrata]